MTQINAKIQPSHSRGSLVQSPDLPIIQQGENDAFSAILLHKKLRVQSIFANWIKRRIEKYGFEEGKDFFPTLEKSSGGRQATDYLLTLDMCKELAMLEENEIGRQMRRAFIEAEKKARGISQLPKEAGLFKGLKPKRINDRELYPFREVLVLSLIHI
jgi:phage anti-repressor protein